MRKLFATAIALLLFLWMSEPSFAWNFYVRGKDMNLPYYIGFGPASKTLSIQLCADKEFVDDIKAKAPWPGMYDKEIPVNLSWFYKGPDPQTWPVFSPGLPTKTVLVGPFPDGEYCSNPFSLKASDFGKDGSWTFKACTTVFPNNCPFLNLAVAGSKPTQTAKMSDQKPGNVVAKPAPGTLATLAKPHLAVVGGKGDIDPACKYLFIASISIKNSGGSLEAGKGTVEVAFGKINGAVGLPAFGQGETKIVKVSVGTPKDFPGPGQWGPIVTLKPQTEGGQSSFITSAPFQYGITVTFQNGYCQTRKP